MTRSILPAIAFCFLIQFAAHAQRGLPPGKKTATRHVTKYAEHLDYLPGMEKMLEVPSGWEVSVAASGLGMPRMLCIGPHNEMYITRRDAGDVLMLKDTNNDQHFESLVTVVADFKTVHGITIKNNMLYLCSNHELRRYPIQPDGKLGAMQKLIDDLPSGGQHANRTIDFGPDGKLYITVGTLCNDCKEADKEVASMLQVDTLTWKRKIYATGLRNTIGFDWHPDTGELWAFDNGGDAKGNTWPPEELNKIIPEGNYGYPLAYGKQEVDESREDPAGNSKEEWVKNTQPSVMELPAHMAPIGFKFFKTSNVPNDYRSDGLVCWHGSWNRSRPVGFKVQRIHFENGRPVKAEDFLTGFLRPGFPLFKRKARFGRPAGIAINNEGVVYISDDANGILYAVKPTRSMNNNTATTK